MAYRTHSWDAELAYQLHTDKKFAAAFFKGLIEDGQDPEVVLRRMVRALVGKSPLGFDSTGLKEKDL